MFYTYIILCENNSYYTGWTTSVPRRFEEHKSGKGAKYTRSFKPVKVVYIKAFKTIPEAMKHECAIKKLTRKQKEQLVSNHAI